MKDDNFSHVLLVFIIFVFSVLTAIVFHSIAVTMYEFTLSSGINVAPPNIQNTIFIDSLVDLILSPSDLLQGIKELWEIRNALTSESSFYLLSIAISLLSVFNIFLSWLFKTRYLSIILSFALIPILVNSVVLLAEYLLSIIDSLLSFGIGF